MAFNVDLKHVDMSERTPIDLIKIKGRKDLAKVIGIFLTKNLKFIKRREFILDKIRGKFLSGKKNVRKRLRRF